jgi:hypothetical protein
MGSTHWSDAEYTSRASLRAATKAPVFAYHADVTTGKTAAKVHDLMDPKRKSTFESRDSVEHPNSNAVAFLIDVTGSGHRVPYIVQEKLPQFMGMLIGRGFLSDPQIMIGGIGDATCDRSPLQIGEFESGLEIEDCLGRLYIEGGGGGSQHESYELAMYAMARHTSIDCWEKRKKRGYLFIIGDELPYPTVSRTQVERILGDKLQADVPTEDIARELQQNYNCHYVICAGSSYYNDPKIIGHWGKLFGPENVHRLQDPNLISEFVAGVIGLTEGVTDNDTVVADMKAVGVDERAAASVSKSLAVYGSSRKAAGRDVKLPDHGSASGIATL